MALSPMMQHYLQIKKENEGTIVFYRLGDFYEMFFEDAELVSRELSLTLTGKECGLSERAPMCGVPYHSVDSYIARLIAKGYKVAICEQMEDAANAKGLVSRAVTRIITPGTVIGGEMLDESKNNFICSMYVSDTNIALSFCDVSTGELLITEVPRKEEETVLERELIKFQPREILFNDQAVNLKHLAEFLREKMPCIVNLIEDEVYDFEGCSNFITSQFEKGSINDLGLESKNDIVYSLGALFDYLKKTQKTKLKQISLPEFYSEDQFMCIDLNTRRTLEIVETMRTKEKKGSLLWVIDKTKTAMGKRLIRSWIERPLVNPVRITKRQDAVEELFSNVILMDELAINLSGFHDLERLIAKVSYGSANARELKSLSFTISKLPAIKNNLKDVSSVILKKIYTRLDPLKDLQILIDTSIVESPSLTLKTGKIICDGFNLELDSLRKDSTGAKELVAEIEDSERKKTNIPKLKVGYNKVFGYYIEVSNSYKDKVPARYIRKQTLVNCERYITEELKNIEMRVLGAKEKAEQLEAIIFDEVKQKVAAQIDRIKITAKMIASLDALLSLARVARQNNYCRPELSTDGRLILKESRHPVAEQMMDAAPFVPNDAMLDNQDNRIYTITGPNMAGKSTYMRQIAIITLMTQMGSFVPASHAEVSVVDSIFTRIGASDDLASGQSTFMVEMNEVAYILKHATENSLIIFDEIGRGTSTFDGMSIARAVLEYVSKNVRAKTLFATHYHELTALEGIVDGVKNYNIAVKKRGEDIIFLRKILRGGTDDSYGIEVAKLAGLPDEVVKRSREVLDEIESGAIVNERKIVNLDSIGSSEDKKLLQNEVEVLEKLKLVDVNVLTPIEAMSTLFELVKALN